MGTISYKDLEVLALLAKMPQQDILYHSQKLMTNISVENQPLARNVIAIRLGGSPSNTDETLVRMANAVIDWGRFAETEYEYDLSNPTMSA